ncbi:Polycystic kidney disease protein 1-like 1 [Manis javanica]|nr:Polycystic kidney disease protein 1-like 1 [Manis javanica]
MRFIHISWVNFKDIFVNWNEGLSLQAVCEGCREMSNLSYSWDLFIVNATEKSSVEGSPWWGEPRSWDGAPGPSICYSPSSCDPKTQFGGYNSSLKNLSTLQLMGSYMEISNYITMVTRVLSRRAKEDTSPSCGQWSRMQDTLISSVCRLAFTGQAMASALRKQ